MRISLAVNWESAARRGYIVPRVGWLVRGVACLILLILGAVDFVVLVDSVLLVHPLRVCCTRIKRSWVAGWAASKEIGREVLVVGSDTLRQDRPRGVLEVMHPGAVGEHT